MGGIIALGILIVILLVIAVSCIQIVPQAHAYVIERLGAYSATWGVGLHFKIPFIERVARRVNLKEQVVDFPPQPVITKDNVTMQIDSIVFFQITDAKLFTYGVENPIMAIENLTATTRQRLEISSVSWIWTRPLLPVRSSMRRCALHWTSRPIPGALRSLVSSSRTSRLPARSVRPWRSR